MQSPSRHADLVLVNGRVHTVDPQNRSTAEKQAAPQSALPVCNTSGTRSIVSASRRVKPREAAQASQDITPPGRHAGSAGS